jgi:hypothetical protein
MLTQNILRASNETFLIFYIRTVHPDTIKVYYSPMNAQVIV